MFKWEMRGAGSVYYGEAGEFVVVRSVGGGRYEEKGRDRRWKGRRKRRVKEVRKPKGERIEEGEKGRKENILRSP